MARSRGWECEIIVGGVQACLSAYVPLNDLNSGEFEIAFFLIGEWIIRFARKMPVPLMMFCRPAEDDSDKIQFYVVFTKLVEMKWKRYKISTERTIHTSTRSHNQLKLINIY